LLHIIYFLHFFSLFETTGLQGCNELTITSTQTFWNRKVNRAEQVIFEEDGVEIEDENGDLISRIYYR
jgi:hypothetical protein